MRQRTIQNKVNFSGVGIHSGKKINATLLPATDNHGIEFRVDGCSVRLHAENVVKIPLCTAINIGHGKHIKTVEHLLSAFNSLLIDNIIVELDGYELPTMDGSAATIFNLIKSAGIKHQSSIKFSYLVTKTVEVRYKDKYASLSPDYRSSFQFTVDFSHIGLASEYFEYVLDDQTYFSEIARARTFGFLDILRRNHSLGLSLGASVDNCLLFDGLNRLVNPDMQTYTNECVRHKILDAIGDLYVVGHRIIGLYSAVKSGHFLNNLLVREALKQNALVLIMHDPKPSEVLPFNYADKAKAVSF